MLEFSKSDLIPLIVEHYQQQLKISTYQLYTYQQKYGTSLEKFEETVKQSAEEKFEMWDDYISWKGHAKSAANLLSMIHEIENGLFEVT